MENAAATASFPVAIVGAGPVGLALALGLARYGVRSVLLEKKAETSRHSKAPAIHVRTREVLRQWGVEDRFLEAGDLLPAVTLHTVDASRGPMVNVDFAELADEAERPGLLILEQARTEALLLEAVSETGCCEVRFASEVIALNRDDDGSGIARLTIRSNGRDDEVRARFVVGCDGASSFVRNAAGLPFEGSTYSLRPLLADVRVSGDRDTLVWPRYWNGGGSFAFGVRMPGGLWRVVSLERSADGAGAGEEVRDGDVRDVVNRVLGPGDAEIVWSSRFRIHIRSSPRFRHGNVLLAGDAAHVHSPASGFGMNAGIHDAHNLAWKLATVLKGGDTERLLDSYDAERRAVVVGTVSKYTDRITRVFIDSPPSVRRLSFLGFRMLFRSRTLRLRTLRRTAMLDLDYATSPLLTAGDSAAGRRLPDPLLRASDGTRVRLHALVGIEPLLLKVGAVHSPDVRATGIRCVAIGRDGYLDPSGSVRRILGGRDGWILVRPDTHTAWARTGSAGLLEAVPRALGTAPPGGRA